MITGSEFAHAVEALLLEHGAVVRFINGTTPILVIHRVDEREVIGFGFGSVFEVCLRDRGYNVIYERVPMLTATPAQVAELIEQAGL
jgi:hypothetical protein